MTAVIQIGTHPRRLAHDITETDLASRIRQGLVTREEIVERFQNSAFAQWFERQGIAVYRHGVLSAPPSAQVASRGLDQSAETAP